MKHKLSITLLLISMFFITQIIGLIVLEIYSPSEMNIISINNTVVNYTSYGLPYNMNPPVEQLTPQSNLFSIVFAMILAVVIMILLMKFRAELFIRGWFFLVVSLAIGVTIYAGITVLDIKYGQIIALVIAIPLAYFKLFKRGFYSHNLTELLIYPGIAAIFVPILTIWTAVILLAIISLYDMYAVWHSGFMQKMAKYQIQKVKIFTGFFVPYKIKEGEQNKKKIKEKNNKNVKLSVAILGGGDVVFPIILAGTVLHTWGFLPALLVSIGATIALAMLFYFSQKGKFYPAMPFISFGCFMALIIAGLLR